MKVTVNVTREHFERAITEVNSDRIPYGSCCILAQALKDIGFKTPRVGFLSFYDDGKPEFPQTKLSRAAINTRTAFDDITNRQFVPCTFDVEIPE